MSIRRFIPDFKILTGNAQITINLRKFPADTAGSSPLGPFTISSSTEKKLTLERDQDLQVLKLQILLQIKVGDMVLLGQMYNQME